MDQFWPDESGELPVVAAAGPGIAAARARPMSADEGHLGSSDRSLQRRAACARTVHLAHGACCRMRTRGTRSTSRFPRTRSPRITWARFTSLPSLELATMPQTHKENQEGLNEGYYSHCSFRSPTQAVPAEINPRSVLNRLFGKTDQTRTASRQADPLDRQMLDLVLGGAKDLRRKLPQDDQHKLDEYLDSVRSVERRIAAIEYPPERGGPGEGRRQRRANATPPIPRPSRSRFPRATNAASTCR